MPFLWFYEMNLFSILQLFPESILHMLLSGH